MASGNSHEHHIVSKTTNFNVFLALIILTIVTVMVTAVDLGASWNLVVALLIACVKVTIVLLWFMHLKYDTNINRVIFSSAMFFVFLFFGLTAADVFYR